MPSPLDIVAVALTVDGQHRFARCWKLERTDGVTLYLTEHDSALLFDGHTYTPMDGIEGSAHRATEGVGSTDFEVRGVLSDATITVADLLARRWCEAVVTEYLVDWQQPQRGALYSKRYIVEDTVHDGREWRGNLVGLTARLQRTRGRKMTRSCDAVFGDARCGYDAASLAATGEVLSVLTERRVFTTDLAEPRARFNNGTLTWLSGANQGLRTTVKNSLLLDGRLTLWLPTEGTIVPGDTFEVQPGCARTYDACQAYDNLVNFRGFDTMPGNDALLRTPDAR